MNRKATAGAFALLALASVTALRPAQAESWLSSEWRSFRNYPRLTEAYRLYKAQRYQEARRMVDQAERIDPENREARTLKFDICQRQQDWDCIRHLGEDWRARKPGDALGPAMLAYLAFVEQRDADMVELAETALRLPGLTPAQRRLGGRIWIDTLLRLGRTDTAAAALALLDSQKVPIAPKDRAAWMAQISPKPKPAAAATPPSLPPSPPPAAPAPSAQMPTEPKPQARSQVKAKPQPKPQARRPRQAPQPAPQAEPPATVAALPPLTPQAQVLPLIEAARYSEAVARLRELQAAGKLSATAREDLVLTLQGRDCASVLALVPDDASAPLTTARQQLSAGYCSREDPARAARHFVAARSLAGTDTALASQALAGEADSLRKLGQGAAADAALAEATRLAPQDAQTHAAYGYALKGEGRDEEALRSFERAWQLDGQRTELLPEMALLAHRLDLRDDAIRHGRAAIDEHDSISRRLRLPDDEAQRRLFGWRRAVQTEEDRFNWSANSTVRLDHGPDGSDAPLSPVDYAQYGGLLGLNASYRYTPLGAQTPTWAFGRVTQGLQDRSLKFEPDNLLLGLGVRQRLSQRYLLVGSAEYLWRKSAEYQNDVMLRLSGSHTWGGDWNPVDAGWTYATVFADLAWLVRQRSHFATLSGEWGWQHKLQDAPFKATVMPYLLGGYAASNDGAERVEVTRLDVGLGLALQTWHLEDRYRAPALSQRLALEVRRVVGGNTTDRHTVQLKWIMLR